MSERRFGTSLARPCESDIQKGTGDASRQSSVGSTAHWRGTAVRNVGIPTIDLPSMRKTTKAEIDNDHSVNQNEHEVTGDERSGGGSGQASRQSITKQCIDRFPDSRPTDYIWGHPTEVSSKDTADLNSVLIGEAKKRRTSTVADVEQDSMRCLRCAY